MKVLHRTDPGPKDDLRPQRSSTANFQSEDGGDDKFARVHLHMALSAIYMWCQHMVRTNRDQAGHIKMNRGSVLSPDFWFQS